MAVLLLNNLAGSSLDQLKTWLVGKWGEGGVGAGDGERCPCKVALMEWAPCHANSQNNAGGTNGFARLTHCVPYSAGEMHGCSMEALDVSTRALLRLCFDDKAHGVKRCWQEGN
jgi:hypothetical protein